MSRRVRIAAEAEAELLAAAEWYEAQEPDAGLGLALLHAVADAHRLVESGHHGSPAPGAVGSARRLPVARFPFWVVFLEVAEEAVVVAYAHEKRRPGYWRGRARRT